MQSKRFAVRIPSSVRMPYFGVDTRTDNGNSIGYYTNNGKVRPNFGCRVVMTPRKFFRTNLSLKKRGKAKRVTQIIMCRLYNRKMLSHFLFKRRSSIGSLKNLSTAAGTTVTIVEVGPRDGLQNESAVALTVEQRVQLVEILANRAGCRKIEVGSFVSPKWVPAMAQSDQVYQQLLEHRRRAQQEPSSENQGLAATTFSCLVPNRKGMEQAQQFPVDEIAIFAAASETFSKKVSQ